MCARGVDPEEPAGSPWAASVDHVVPRALKGDNAAANRRLAHRRCNSRRGSRIPELAWPAELEILDQTALWPLLQRAVRTAHSWEIVALAATEERARAASAWVVERATLIMGGSWEATACPAATVWTVSLRARAVA